MVSLIKVDKLDPQSGTALEIGTSGDTITVPSGATLDISSATLTPPATLPASSGVNLTALNATNLGSGTVAIARGGTGAATFAAAGLASTPYFYGRMPSDLTIAADTEVKLTGMTTNEIDPDSVWDGTTFTPAVAGYYFLHANIAISWASAGNDGNRAQSMWFFNGADLTVNNIFLNDSASTALMAAGNNSILKYFDADDYMELYVYTGNSGSTSGTKVQSYTHIEGFKLIG